MNNKIIKEIIVILVLTIFCAFVRFLFLAEDFSLIKKTKKIDSIEIDLKDTEKINDLINNLISPQLIDLDIAKIIYDKQVAIFVDARDPESYDLERIQGSINVPYDFLIEYNLEILKEALEFNDIVKNDHFIIGSLNNVPYLTDSNAIVENKEVYVIYCSGEGCSLSEDLAFYLYEELGFVKILIYEGGIPEWKKNNYPVEK
tara:strand:+ start:54 stop:659 length:606 start_codon:yes stop_codon:yes gene_type:complete